MPSKLTSRKYDGFEETALCHLDRNVLTECFRSTPRIARVDVLEYRKTERARIATEKLIKLPDRPTCIFYPDDFSALGGIAAIKEAGLEIPRDISIVGYDGIRVGRHLTPSLTTLRQPTELIGETAAQKLISLIEHPLETQIEKVVIKGRLYDGGSVLDLRYE